ncbi:MAG: class D sortase [Ruminococcaceae bacterium]|nr:class D sortase [Oscillospiraceae bacterium]
MKKLLCTLLSLCFVLALSAPVFADDYTIPEPDDPEYADDTSVEVVYTADGGAASNEDVSKNAAFIPPAFGSPSAYTPNNAAYLTPNLVPNAMAATGAGIGGEYIAPPSYGQTEDTPLFDAADAPQALAEGSVTTSGTRPYTESANRYTDVTSDLYYADGSLGTLKIPAIGVNVKVYQGTGSDTLAKGAGHFEDSSVWDGNVAIAGHNRGANCCFGEIHTLNIGDTITLSTKLGTRTYAVTSVAKVSETDRSGLAATSDNTLTLYTCVRDQRAFRWCVSATEIP